MVGEEPKKKQRRNRVPISCYSCRTLKTKCNGARPVCSTCAHSGRRCVFSDQGIIARGEKKVLVKEDYLHRLESRLEYLERISVPVTSDATEHASPFSSHQNQRALISACSAPSMVAPSERKSPPMALDAGVSIGGASFTQLIMNSLEGQKSPKVQSTMANTETEVRSRQACVSLNDPYALPDNTAEVLDRFFACRNNLTPLFHQPSAQAKFDEALNSPPEEAHLHQSSFILLHMILALCTSHWLVTVETNAHTARKHYDIAMTLLQPALLRKWTLENVQALLLGARYLQGTNCGDECWNVLGLAIRIAQGLRLHQEPPDTDSPPLRETKRRTWYAAYTLDNHLSMVYERPPAIRSSECTVCVPEDLDEHCIQVDRLLFPTPKMPSAMSFLLQNIKLYRLVEKAMAKILKNVTSHKETAEQIMSLDEEYQKWHREIPAHLVLDYNDATEPSWILALRGRMVQILIHRQSLKLSLFEGGKPERIEESIVDNILRSSQTRCVTAAMESIDIVALRHEQTKETMGLDWFNVYYLFNAAITLVSYIINPFYSQDQSALDKMDKALHMIKSMSKNHSFAERSYSFLQQLIGYMHQSPDSQRRRSSNIGQSQNSAQLPATEPQLTTMSSSADEVSDFYTLYGYAQNLTDSLQAQLGDFDLSHLSESLWTFDESTFD